ncbi:hypothetical protein ACFPYM_05115, partial [Methylobacterium hispanicum]
MQTPYSTTPRPDGIDPDLWAVLSERLRNYLARHPGSLPVIEASVYRHLPATVDLEWVRSKLTPSMPTHAAAHAERARSQNVVAFTDWPDTHEVSLDDVALVHLQAMRMPLGLFQLSRAYVRKLSDPTTLHAGFRDWIRKTVALAGFGHDGLLEVDEDQVLRALIDKGENRRARDFAILATIGSSPEVEVAPLCEEFGDVLGLREHWDHHAKFLLRFAATCHEQAFVHDASPPAGKVEELVYAICRHDQPGPYAFLVFDMDNEGYPPIYQSEGGGEADDGRPTVPVPTYVDGAWLRERLALSGAIRSQLHRSRELLAVFAPAGWWPSEKPSGVEIEGRLLAALSMPHVLAVINYEILARSPAECGAWESSPFRTFYRKIAALLRSYVADGVSPDGSADGVADRAALAVLIEFGHIDLAREFAVLRGAELFDEDFVSLMEGRDEFEEEVAFLKARRQLKAWTDRRVRIETLDGIRRLSNREIQAFGPDAPPSTRRRHPQAPASSPRRKHRPQHRVEIMDLPTADVSPVEETVRGAAEANAERWSAALGEASALALALA